jgi:hypothetical protein
MSGLVCGALGSGQPALRTERIAADVSGRWGAACDLHLGYLGACLYAGQHVWLDEGSCVEAKLATKDIMFRTELKK